MTTAVIGVRTLTELDFVRLHRLAAAEHCDELHDELSNMDVLPSAEVPGEVVTMHSRACIVHADTGLQQEVTLSYPHEAQPGAGLVSVLSPLGRALLGLSVGDVARWASPGGGTLAAKVSELLYQPEANGDLTA